MFNAGKGKGWFFFTTHSAIQCAGLTTGQTAPYPGFVSQQGKYMVTDVPLPPDVSTKVANQPNFYGSLIKESLNWAKVTTKVNGKTVGNQASVACLRGKRPWSIAAALDPRDPDFRRSRSARLAGPRAQIRRAS